MEKLNEDAVQIHHTELAAIAKSAGFENKFSDYPLGSIVYEGDKYKFAVAIGGFITTPTQLNIWVECDTVALVAPEFGLDFSDILDDTEKKCGYLPDEILWGPGGESSGIRIDCVWGVSTKDMTPLQLSRTLRTTAAEMHTQWLYAIEVAQSHGWTAANVKLELTHGFKPKVLLDERDYRARYEQQSRIYAARTYAPSESEV